MKNIKFPQRWHLYQSHDFVEQFHYDGDDLGITLGSKSIDFKLWSPVAESVLLRLFKSGDLDSPVMETVKMIKTEGGIWEYSAEKKWLNHYYTYEVTAFGKKQETADIHGKACGINGKRSMILDLSKTNPPAWTKDTFSYDKDKQPIIYELHIKDFSYDSSCGVPPEHRGKFMAFTSHKKGIAHMKKLGVTHVHLLPIYDFGSVDEGGDGHSFNWGYDPIHYNIPEGSYATDAHDGRVRIKELKTMILALHKAGIGVIMDVVYNHTFERDSCFQKTVPDYFYRTDYEGNFKNGSGCGNETASERSMVRKYIIDSILYWAKEYHINGFRFDLMGVHDIETMNQIRRALNTLPQGEEILMYGEPWSAEEVHIYGGVPANKHNLNLLDTNIAIFSDDSRDTIKGSVFDGDHCGFANGNMDSADAIPSVVQAWCDQFIRHPRQIITYVSAHDNFTLYDKLVLSISQNTEDYQNVSPDILRYNRLCAGIIFTSCGASFFQAGEEFARTKNGINDSYNSPPEVNQLDWKRAEAQGELVEFYSQCIAYRKTIPALMNRRGNPTTDIHFLPRADRGILAFSVTDDKGRENLIIYNGLGSDFHYILPPDPWILCCHDSKFQKPKAISQEIHLIRNSMTILHRS